MKLDPQKLSDIAHSLEAMGCVKVAKEVRALVRERCPLTYSERRLIHNLKDDVVRRTNKMGEGVEEGWRGNVTVDRKTDSAKIRSAIYYIEDLVNKTWGTAV